MQSADAELDETLEPLKAAVAGRYVIDRRLGEGGMGRVYLAHDEALQRRVAIKVIQSDHAASAQVRARFLHEARVVASLRHPAIVTVFAAGESDGMLWFAMEYIEGETLRDVLTREHAMSADRVYEILFELAAALDAAHRLGIVHRDVKPENILVERGTGRVRLADFGIARARIVGGEQTGTGILVGSPRYMSPEQVASDGTLDGRSDLYALALVGHELLTGKPVVRATSPAAMLVEQLTTEAPPIRDVLPEVPLPLAQAIDRALAKHVDARWPDAQAMLRALGADQTSAVERDTITLSSGTKTSTRFPRRLVGVVAALSVAVALVIAILLWRERPASDKARALVVLPFDVPSGYADVAWLREGAVNMLTLAFGQWHDLDVVDFERTLDLMRASNLTSGRVSLSEAMALAKRANAGSVVLGHLAPSGDSLVIVARRYDARGALLRTAQVAFARNADPRAAFDVLATTILDVPATGSLIALTNATTSSIEAYRTYLEGLSALNRWHLDRADSLFTRAVVLDSTFALAWYKRGLTRGWNGFGDSTPSSAEIALRHAARLPERERRLVAGHRWLWSALADGDSAVRLTAFDRAINEYRAALLRDGASAEAWYGLADGLWHAAQFRPDSALYPSLMLESRRAFERALAIDPEQHLAYSHLVDFHRQLGTTASAWLFVGDKIVREDSIRDSTVRATARRRERDAVVAVAAQWANADPDSPRPWLALGQALSSAGRPDSAAALFRTVGNRLGAESQGLALQSAFYDIVAGSGGTARTLRSALGDGSLRWWPSARTAAPWIMALAVSSAAAAGDAELIDSLFSAWGRAEQRVEAAATHDGSASLATSVLLSQQRGMRATLAPWWRIVLRASMGEPLTTASRLQLRRQSLALLAVPTSENTFVWSFASTAYAAWMLTGDTVHAVLARRGSEGATWPELDAAMALSRGDTMAARTASRAFPSVARVRSTNLGLAGLRTMQRALVQLALGDSVAALNQLESLEPARFAINFLEPGLTWYVRTLDLRAALAERLGQPESARHAWEELATRWASNDPLTAPSRDAAQRGLQRLARASPSR